MKNEIDRYVGTIRKGCSMGSVDEYHRSGIDNTHYTDFYRRYADEEGESTAKDVIPQIPKGYFSSSVKQTLCLTPMNI